MRDEEIGGEEGGGLKASELKGWEWWEGGEEARKREWEGKNGGDSFPPRRPPPWNSITPCLQLSTLNPLYWIQSVCRCISEFDQFYGERVSR